MASCRYQLDIDINNNKKNPKACVFALFVCFIHNTVVLRCRQTIYKCFFKMIADCDLPRQLLLLCCVIPCVVSKPFFGRQKWLEEKLRPLIDKFRRVLRVTF